MSDSHIDLSFVQHRQSTCEGLDNTIGTYWVSDALFPCRKWNTVDECSPQHTAQFCIFCVIVLLRQDCGLSSSLSYGDEGY